MSGPARASLDGLAVELVREQVAPDVALGWSSRRAGGKGWVRACFGQCDRLFDLASLTKPMTAMAVARAGLDRETRLAQACPELGGTATADVPLELFLAHRAGLVAHLPLYEPLTRGGSVDAGAARRAIADGRREETRGPVPEGGFSPLYSDLGYVLAGEALARSVGTVDAGEAIERLVAAPLGLDAELGTARGLSARGVDVARASAPTEDVAWRGGVVRGRVHDENAWALTGLGGSGHAGMFGTIGAVLRFGEHVLSALESGEAPRWLVAERPGGTLRAGFDGKSAEGSSAGPSFGARSFGHLGFTGTSLWIDPDARVVAALLTNRVHPTRANERIRAARPRVHDLLFRAAVA